jgi:MoaA/NifB/PqqE/SkfB family radical SAM enzyme
MTTAPPVPSELQVEVTGACNLRCRMCLVRYRPPLGRLAASMPVARFRALLDELPGVQRVTLQGLGEPLLAPDLLAMVALARERGAEVGFNTNGMLLGRERSAQLVALGVDWLHVSLDGALAATHESIRGDADFDRIAANVRELVAVRREAGAARPRLALNVVAMRRNVQELAGIVRLAAEWGVERVWVQNLSHSFGDRADDPSFAAIRTFTAAEALWDDDEPVRHAVDAARAEAAARGVDLRVPRVRSTPRPPRPPGQPGCDWPWRSAYVRHDGLVQPCCMLMGEDRAILGDAGRDGFTAVWNGAPYRAFREALLGDAPPEVCRGCSEYRGVF